MTVEVVENMLNTALARHQDLNWKVLVRKSLEEYLAILSTEPAPTH
ncbi:hypothetical protein [Nocardia tengchongensis]